ncbi:MAG: Ig-like domain-containing protein [Deltaproteobacteria bacterium]|nr:Ig-like domain-containing protein [Deltaproteobacteria bacterium]
MRTKINSRLLRGIMILFAVFMVNVYGCGEPELGNIEIEPDQKTLPVGETADFKAVLLSTDGEVMQNVFVEWRVKGEAGSIDKTGTFKALQPGEATVIAETEGISEKAQVTVEALPLAGLELNPESAETRPESTVQISIIGSTAAGESAGYHEIQVATPTKTAHLNTKTVTLNESGRAQVQLTVPELPGKVVVTASRGDIKTQTEITVIPRPVSRFDAQPEAERALTASVVPVRIKGLSDADQAAAMNRIAVSSSTPGTVLSTDELVLDNEGTAQLKVTSLQNRVRTSLS